MSEPVLPYRWRSSRFVTNLRFQATEAGALRNRCMVWRHLVENKVAEGVGFEPTRPFRA
jgi:hypothetical protein